MKMIFQDERNDMQEWSSKTFADAVAIMVHQKNILRRITKIWLEDTQKTSFMIIGDTQQNGELHLTVKMTY